MAEEESKDLLNALESIKGLLEQSESKLNAARESIGMASGINKLPEPDVEEIGFDEETFEVPVLNDIVVPATTEGAAPTVDIEVLKAFLDEMQSKIEKTMRDTLMKAVVQAETDIKKQMRAYLNQLRKMLDEQS